ncbi:hypothetical protein POJ06DRAFT_28025, partial [Lipomyces tetrasporus]
MRNQINYLDSIGQERAIAIVDSKQQSSRTNLTGCWLFHGSLNSDGYGQVWVKPNHLVTATGRSVQKAYLIHIIAYISKYPEEYDRASHISHLCANRQCFNPRHLCQESPQLNNQRKGCNG